MVHFENRLERCLTIFHFHAGLLTNIGMVVANPAYDRNTTNIEVLNRGAYHGTVIWSVFRNVEYGVRGSGFSPEFGTFLGLGSKA